MGEKAREARARLTVVVERGKVVCQQLQDYTSAGARVADRAFRKNPYPTLGAVLGFGFILGVLINRR
jgi:ElaB/YqjD/DUF883 family membrane-anchored ribosome-binding protein